MFGPLVLDFYYTVNILNSWVVRCCKMFSQALMPEGKASIFYFSVLYTCSGHLSPLNPIIFVHFQLSVSFSSSVIGLVFPFLLFLFSYVAVIKYNNFYIAIE